MQILCRLTATIGEHNWLNRSHTLGLVIKNLLDAQVQNNRLYLQLHSRVPPLYHSGVRYENEPLWRFQDMPVEEFALIPVVLGRGWGDCLHEESEVLTTEGEKPIKLLSRGDLVVTREGPKKLLEVCKTASRARLFDVQTESGASVLATARHRFNTPRGYLRASELERGDFLILRERNPSRLEAVRPLPAEGATWDLTVEDVHHFYARRPGTRIWMDVHNCDDLAPWRVAELQAHGEKAKIRIQWKRPTLANGSKGKKYFHIVVRRQNGSIEDPSAKLGMYERMGAAT
jgi:hypothetical protein